MAIKHAMRLLLVHKSNTYVRLCDGMSLLLNLKREVVQISSNV